MSERGGFRPALSLALGSAATLCWLPVVTVMLVPSNSLDSGPHWICFVQSRLTFVVAGLVALTGLGCALVAVAEAAARPSRCVRRAGFALGLTALLFGALLLLIGPVDWMYCDWSI